MPMTFCRHVERPRAVMAAVIMWLLCFNPSAIAQDVPPKFVTPFSLDEMTAKQAVIKTDRGQFIIDLLPKAAPNHVGYFIKSAREGVYDGTIFHRMVRHGIVQGGDPLTKDLDKAESYGQGCLELRLPPWDSVYC